MVNALGYPGTTLDTLLIPAYPGVSSQAKHAIECWAQTLGHLSTKLGYVVMPSQTKGKLKNRVQSLGYAKPGITLAYPGTNPGYDAHTRVPRHVTKEVWCV